MKLFFRKISNVTQASCNSKLSLLHNELFSVTTSVGTVNVFSLFLPMFISSISSVLIGTINTAVLSGYSEVAVAATGTVNTLINLFNLLLIAINTGVSVVISNYLGGEKLKKAAETGFVSILTCAMIGLAVSVSMFIFSHPVIELMNLEGEVLEQGIIYFRIRIAAMIIPATTGVLSAILQCYGYPKFTIIANLTSVVCNLFFNIFVVYFPEYSPVKGVAGIAWGSVLSQLIALLIVLCFIIGLKIKIQPPKTVRDYFLRIGRVLKVGIPSSLSGGSFTLSQVITTAFIATLGTTAINAKVYYANILTYAYMFSMNLGNANSLLIGRLTGAERYDHARRLNRTLVKITTSVNFAISMSIVLLRVPLLSMFTDNQSIIELGLTIFLIDIITEQARAVSQIYEYALRAAGDVTFTLIVVTLSCWGCSVGLAYVLSISCGLGLVGIWIALALDESIRAVATFLRWRSNKWVGILKT